MMKDFRIDNDSDDSFIVLSPDEVILVDSNNVSISPRYSRLIDIQLKLTSNLQVKLAP